MCCGEPFAVGADDVTELVRQIVLVPQARAGPVHRNAGTDRGRGDGKNRDDHPLGPSLRDVEANVDHLIVRHAAEDVEGHLWGDDFLLLGLHTILILVFNAAPQREGLLADDRLHISASSMTLGKPLAGSCIGVEFAVLGLLGGVVIASLLALADVPNALEPDLGVPNSHGSGILRVRLVKRQHQSHKDYAVRYGAN
jgi:hypothetical protein